MKKILIADDEAYLRFILKETIDSKKYIVHEAADGLEALEIAEKENPDIILLDIAMPKISGYEVAKKLINNKSKSKIIMLSAKAQKTDMEKGLSMGAHYYITKPFDLIKLSKLIDEIAE
jgi:DNA-binding response OmpR family regulator